MKHIFILDDYLSENFARYSFLHFKEGVVQNRFAKNPIPASVHT